MSILPRENRDMGSVSLASGKLRAQEVWLMILPVLALCGLGAWLRHRGPVAIPTDKFALTVSSIRLMPLTGLEASRGYDTKLEILVTCQGRTPAWWGGSTHWNEMAGVLPLPPQHNLQYAAPGRLRLGYSLYLRKRGQLVRLTHPGDPLMTIGSFNFDAARDGYILPCLCKAEPVPANGAAIELHAVVGIDRDPALSISYVLRPFGQPFAPIAVSRSCPLTLKSVTYDAAAKQYQVAVKFASDSSRHDAKIAWVNMNLADERGTEYGGLGFVWNLGNEFFQYNREMDDYEGNIGWQTIPPGHGQITLKNAISVNDCWPLSFHLVVRDHAGKTVTNPVAVEEKR